MKLNNQKLKFDDFEMDLKKPLGSGYISKVYKATHRVTKQIYAVKIVI